MKINKKKSIPLLIVSILLGIIIGLQIRTISKNLSIKTEEGVLRSKELALELKKTSEERDNQREEIEKLNDLISEYENKYMNSDETTKLLYSEIEKYKKMACLTELEGQGVIININDAYDDDRKISSIVDNPEIILKIISVLNSSGAEAISVNAQRIGPHTEVERAGNFIEINGVSVSSPIVIKTIGDKDTIIPALNINTGVIDSLRNYHFDVIISEDDNLKIEKLNMSKDFKYAESVKNEK